MRDLLKSRERAGLGDASVCTEPPDNDLLSEVLRDLRLAHASYGRSELTAPWGIAVPFREGVRFHAVLEGQCWIEAKSLPRCCSKRATCCSFRMEPGTRCPTDRSAEHYRLPMPNPH